MPDAEEEGSGFGSLSPQARRSAETIPAMDRKKNVRRKTSPVSMTFQFGEVKSLTEEGDNIQLTLDPVLMIGAQ